MKENIATFCIVRLVAGAVLIAIGGLLLTPNSSFGLLAATWTITAGVVSWLTAAIDGVIIAES